MTSKAYTRPVKTKASTVGTRNRSRWSRLLRKELFTVFTPTEFMAAEEGATNATARRTKSYDRPRWSTVRVRVDQLAAIELLQQRHLEVTGKEISRAEVLAALMTAGLKTIADHSDFARDHPNE